MTAWDAPLARQVESLCEFCVAARLLLGRGRVSKSRRASVRTAGVHAFVATTECVVRLLAAIDLVKLLARVRLPNVRINDPVARDITLGPET